MITTPRASPLPFRSGREFPKRNFSRFEPVNRERRTSNIQHPTSNIQGSASVQSLDVGRSMLDVGCFPGSWGGRSLGSRLAKLTRQVGWTGGVGGSLSLRERAGVKGNRASLDPRRRAVAEGAALCRFLRRGGSSAEARESGWQMADGQWQRTEARGQVQAVCSHKKLAWAARGSQDRSVEVV
jgi:hypothetical protein